jgi:hypothetical protein
MLRIMSRFGQILCSPFIITLFALVVRIALAIPLSQHNLFLSNEPSHIAAHLANGEGFSSPYDWSPLAPTAQQPPLYPFLLSLVFRLAGVYSHRSLLIIFSFNILLGSFVCFLIYRVGERYLSRSAAVIASWLWALVPAVAAADLYLSNYVIAAAFILGVLLMLPWFEQRPAWFGIYLGIGGLLNPMLLLTWLASWQWMPRKSSALTAMLVAFGVMSPWMVRNYFVMGHVYLALRDSFGQALYVGNHPGMKPGDTYDYSDAQDDAHQFSVRGEDGFMRWKLLQALAFIRSSPSGFALRSFKRMQAFWLSPYRAFYGLVLIFCFAGAVSESPSRFFTITMFLLYPLAFYVTETAWAVSYRHPIEPLVLLCAGHGLARGVRKFSSGSAPGRLCMRYQTPENCRKVGVLDVTRIARTTTFAESSKPI